MAEKLVQYWYRYGGHNMPDTQDNNKKRIDGRLKKKIATPGIDWHNTKYPGVRFREHRTRWYEGKRDRYYQIRYRKDNMTVEEVVGWQSEDMSLDKAHELLATIKGNIRLGISPQSIKEMRALEDQRRQEEEQNKQKSAKDSMTFDEFWAKMYYPNAQLSKTKGSYDREEDLYLGYIKQVIGNKPFKMIAPMDLEKLKSTMKKKNCAARSIEYGLAVVRQVFNYAHTHGFFDGEPPTRKVKLGKKEKGDNQRQRFLTKDEAETLLGALKAKSQQVFEMALISLHCGLRAGEIFSLRWADINLEKGRILVRNAKNSRDRTAYMTQRVRDMFAEKLAGNPDELVFPDRNGDMTMKISNVFPRTVEDLNLNKGYDDRKGRVVFHTLRHTYASWLADKGTPMITLMKLMGHQSLTMTVRYSHASQETLEQTTRIFDETPQVDNKNGNGDAPQQDTSGNRTTLVQINGSKM
jgi:integrase